MTGEEIELAIQKVIEMIADGKCTVDTLELIKEAEKEGIPEGIVKAVIEKLISDGKLQRSNIDILADKLGIFVIVDNTKFYTHSPEEDLGISLPLIKGEDNDKSELSWLFNLVRDGDIVLDIGANIGRYTIALSRLVGSGRVLAFEPDLDNFSILQRNITTKQCYNVSAFQCAVGDKFGLVELHLNRINRGDHRAWKPEESDTTWKPNKITPTVSVPCISLDDLNLREKISLIKIDTQGSEVAILHGSQKLLARSNITLILEFWPLGLRGARASESYLENILKTFNYRIYELKPNASLEPVTKSLSSLIPKDSSDFLTLVCFK